MTNTDLNFESPTVDRDDMAEERTREDHAPRRTTWLVLAIALIVVALLAVVWVVTRANDGADRWQTAGVREQGAGVTEPASYAPDGARLERRPDGLSVEVVVPTPEPGSYEYPTNDMIPPWVESHPTVTQGAQDAPEIFTLWLIAFNEPGSCTEGTCDADDIGTDTAARGGVYQVNGRIGDDDTLRFVGGVRLGQQPSIGSPLEDPLGADVHLAIAPHGRALSGTDRIVQLNTPVGNPSLWWGAEFPAS